MEKKNSLNISAKSFIAAIVIIFLLMALTYALTFLVPGGEYARTVDEAGHTIIDTQTGFKTVEGGLPFWKWLLSPLLVLGSEGSGALIAVIAFLLVIGGVFNALNECGLMGYMLQKLVHRFGGVRYRLMAVLILFFMAMGSLVGSFEEVVPLVPIVTALAVGLGWPRRGLRVRRGRCQPLHHRRGPDVGGAAHVQRHLDAACVLRLHLCAALFLRSRPRPAPAPSGRRRDGGGARAR